MSNSNIEINSLSIDESPYKYISEKAKLVGKEIEKSLVGLSIKETTELLECVRRSIYLNSKVSGD